MLQRPKNGDRKSINNMKPLSQCGDINRAHLTMPIQSKVHRYKPEEISLDDLAAKAFSILHKKPFVWQLEIALAILCGEDVIIDVGTGSGKTLCFSLPLILNDTDMVLTVSPLTALMIDQESIYISRPPFRLTAENYRQQVPLSQQLLSAQRQWL